MENRRAIIISLICFLVSMLLITAYVQVKRAELTSDFGEEVTVVVATRAIPEYGIIRENMLEEITVFKKFRQPQTVTSMTEIAGKAAFVPIYPGEQITLTKLVTQDGRPVLARQVAKNTRAITIPVTVRNAVSKLIRPGNRVDIMTVVNYDPGDNNMVFEAKTMVQNALVLATGKNLQNEVPTRVNRDVMNFLETKFEDRKDFGGARTDILPNGRPADDYNSLTLQLSPEDAERVLFVATKYGDSRLFFTLRNSGDQAADPVETTLLAEVLGPESDFGLSQRKPPEPPAPRPPKFFDSVGGSAIGVD
ncbi:Flp pilus assembly protein CpaB [bacterium]|nr:Flp pilus assembly protein CpaB [bacterium]